MSRTGETISFDYNEDGLRTKKTVATGNSTVVTEYVLHGKNVVHLTRGTDVLHFYYDAQGKPAIVIFNGTAYGYLYNLQGDVIALVDGTGTKVVEYSYDAWGKPTGKTGSLAGMLGTVQPFWYRGYVFDEETGDYYLRSRNYRPERGRFLNADTTVGSIEDLLSPNNFTYCYNLPIVYWDANGSFPFHGLDIPFYAIFHDKVKKDVADLNLGMTTERPANERLNRGKRIDLVDANNGFYEVKPDYGYYYSGRLTEILILGAVFQLWNYVVISQGNETMIGHPGEEQLNLPVYPVVDTEFFSFQIKVRQEHSIIYYHIDVDIHQKLPILVFTAKMLEKSPYLTGGSMRTGYGVEGTAWSGGGGRSGGGSLYKLLHGLIDGRVF